eukprot:768632-Hanusia_phi.AAC.4
MSRKKAQGDSVGWIPQDDSLRGELEQLISPPPLSLTSSLAALSNAPPWRENSQQVTSAVCPSQTAGNSVKARRYMESRGADVRVFDW